MSTVAVTTMASELSSVDFIVVGQNFMVGLVGCCPYGADQRYPHGGHTGSGFEYW